MAITAIGGRLIRTIGEGKNLRKVVTEMLDGKTFTRVLDATSNDVLLNRVKKIERTTVGNKKVNTITKVTESSSRNGLDKTTYDRVYDKESKFLGSRLLKETIQPTGVVKDYVVKQGASILAQAKSFNDVGRVVSKVALNKYPGSFYKFSDSISLGNINYNIKGLPCPPYLHFNNNFSLKEMRNWHFENNPHLQYAAPELKLGFLDQRAGDKTLSAMNDLDKYL